MSKGFLYKDSFKEKVKKKTPKQTCYLHFISQKIHGLRLNISSNFTRKQILKMSHLLRVVCSVLQNE